MKLFAFAFVGVLSVIPTLSSASCLNITGDYDSGFIQEGKGNLIWSFKQDSCDAISTASYYLWGSTKSDEVAPTINYVHAGKTDLCEVKACFIFTETESGLVYDWDGSIKVNGVYSCRYDRVEISLDGENFVRTFYINDVSPNCKKTKSYSVSLKRVQ
ncbi:MAG: hypothetical protein H6623_07420 [Bdellovibrionaceae bacterium]|nr:hypothetical protein [Pseudobdellovibrionaceae bacterium]